MKPSGKVIAAIVVVALLAGAALLAQQSISSPTTVSLSAQDMEMWIKEIFPPTQLQQLASDPEEKKKLVKNLKRIIAVGQYAESKGFAERPEIKSELTIIPDSVLGQIFLQKNPDRQVSDEEVNQYHKDHPDDFKSFMEIDPKLKEEAQGPQGERIKKQYGQIKVLAELARQAGLESEKFAEIQVLLSRNQFLYQAYVRDYQENLGETENDAEMEQYLKEHEDEFRNVRHILIGTSPPPPSPTADKKEDAKDTPKVLSKEEARQKAQSILDRIRKGEDFVKLAAENSDDPGSKDNGGSYGIITRDEQFVPEFLSAAFALKPGEISDPVETQFGFHIIKVDAIDASALSDPQTKQKIAGEIKQAKILKHLDEIVAASSVEIAEDFNIEAPPSPAIQPAPSQVAPPAQNQ
ncbi:MAG: peptidylprolyl isomerase [Blastocatellia bacterium]|nr:peptidylprolyl isomerase [Blastocatellia bacterium]